MAISKEKIKKHIKKIIRKKMRLNIKYDQMEEEGIMDKYGITSLAAFKLLIIFEKKFKVLMEEDDLSLDNFDSINKLSNIIYFKLAEK